MVSYHPQSDLTTAKTIATSLIHSKVDYCNSLYLNLPRTQLDRLQLILNSAARALYRTPRFTHISPVLKSLHWLKIGQRIHFKILSITYKTLQSRNPSCRSQSFASLISYVYSFLWFYHTHTPCGLISTQNDKQIIHPPGTCSLERSS